MPAGDSPSPIPPFVAGWVLYALAAGWAWSRVGYFSGSRLGFGLSLVVQGWLQGALGLAKVGLDGSGGLV